METSPVFLSGFEKCKIFSKLKLNPTDYQTIKQNSLFPFCINTDSHLIGKIESDKNGNYHIRFFMSYCSVIQTEISTETQQATLIIQYFDGISNVESAFAGEILTKVGARELLNKGIRFREQDVQLVIEYILRSAALSPTIKSFTKHGFIEKDNTLSYFYRSLVGNSLPKELYVYRGDKDLESHGDLSKWISMIETEVIGNQALEFVLLCSFVSPILSALNLRYDLGSILIHLANHSSRGKTTAAMLAASVWSNPLLNKGTAISYNGTENALADFISGCNGLCVVLDESSVMQTQNLQKFLFEVTLGRSKMRLNGESTQKPVKEFSSVLISTSESNFIDEETILGIKARVFELTANLTTSAENSEKIKSTIIMNYALAGEPFLEHLTSKGLFQIIDDYESLKTYLISEFHKKSFSACENSIADRILSKFALILLARDYFEEVFSVSVKRDSLILYLLKTAESIEVSPTMETRILNLVFADVTENAAKYYSFPEVKMYADKISPIYGIVRASREQGYQEVGILDSRFDKLLKMNRIPKTEARKALRSLRESGQLVAPPDRERVKIPLSESRPNSLFYLFKYQSDTKLSA